MDNVKIAKNALLWLSKLKKTQVKQQSFYLGSSKNGYSAMGFGCKLFDLEYYPDIELSEEFFKVVGLRDKEGIFESSIKVSFENRKHKFFTSVKYMQRELTFNRLANVLLRYGNIRKAFKPGVAEEMINILSNGRI